MSWGWRLWRRVWKERSSCWRMGRERPAGCILHSQDTKCCMSGNTDYTSRTALMVTLMVVMRIGRSWYNVFSV